MSRGWHHRDPDGGEETAPTDGWSRRAALRTIGGAVAAGVAFSGGADVVTGQEEASASRPRFGDDDANAEHAGEHTKPEAGDGVARRFRTDDDVRASPAVVDVGSDDDAVYAVTGGTSTAPSTRRTADSRLGGNGGRSDGPFVQPLSTGVVDTADPSQLAVILLVSVGALAAGTMRSARFRNQQADDGDDAERDEGTPPTTPSGTATSGTPPTDGDGTADDHPDAMLSAESARDAAPAVDTPGYAATLEGLPEQVRGHVEDGLGPDERFVSAVETLGTIRSNTWLALTADRLVEVNDNLYDVTESTADDLARVAFERSDGIPRVRVESGDGTVSTYDLRAGPERFFRDLIRTHPGLSVDPPDSVDVTDRSETVDTGSPRDRTEAALTDARTAEDDGAFDDALDRPDVRSDVSDLAEGVEAAERRLEAGDPLDALRDFGRLLDDATRLEARAATRDLPEVPASVSALAVRCRAGKRAAQRRLDRKAVARLHARLDRAEHRLEQFRGDLETTSVSALRPRLDAVTESVDAVAKTAEGIDDERLRSRAANLRDRASTCRDAIDLRVAVDDARGRLDDALDLLADDPAEADERLTAIEDDLDAIARRADAERFRVFDTSIESLRERCRTGLDRTAELLRDRPPETIPTVANADVDYGALERQGLLGKGGNADVYLVTEADRTRELAIKEPRMAGTLHTETVDRLMGEAETWDKLDGHDHVVDVVDYDADPLPWIAMEYMDAGDLTDRAGDLGFDQTLWTAIAVTKGVRHAHRHGIAHLDLKPKNVLFRSVDGAWDVPKVADWGLSKHLLEHSKSLEGLSPQYAAPEQFDDEYGSTDDITDIYQLGAVLYELFTGRPPFEGPPTKVMRRVLDEEPTPPSDFAPVPSALDDVLLTALEKRKRDRYESVLLLRDALRDLRES